MMKYSLMLSHFAAAVIISAIILLLYASVQQVHRSSANDPQLQTARDLSNAISLGKSLNNLISHDTIDLTKSLALFTEVFDKNGNPIQSTGILNGELPKPPAGVIQYTNSNTENVLTWQPQNGLRLAMVFEKINAPGEGFVAVGRSLKETEIREGNLLRMCGIAWAACIAVLLVHFLIQVYYSKKVHVTFNMKQSNMMKENSPTTFRQPMHKTFANAFNGLSFFFKKERNGQIQAGVSAVALIAGLYFHISNTEWIAVLLCIGAVLSLEIMNSSLEHLCNLVHSAYHPSIKIIKDVAAGAVLFTSVVSVIIGLLIFLPKIF